VRRIVPKSTLNQEPRVLHIRSSPSERAEGIDACLAGGPLDVDVCTDVYRGLARLCADKAYTPHAVIVDVSGLGPHEMEFFSLLPRVRRGLSAYVYGDQWLESRIAKAIELGADGRATEEIFRSIAEAQSGGGFTDLQSEPPPSLETSETPPPSRPPVVESPIAQVSTPIPAAADDAEVEEGEVDDEPAEEPVRVPWLRYEDRPTRTAPKRPAKPSRKPPDSQREPAAPKTDQPLLTEAELQALLGGDISAGAPDEPHKTAGDEPGGGKATS
jgi:hypothetical protein